MMGFYGAARRVRLLSALILGCLASAGIIVSPAAAAVISVEADAFDSHTGIGDFHGPSDMVIPDAKFSAMFGFSTESAAAFAAAGFGVLSASASASGSTTITTPIDRFNDPHPVFPRGFGQAKFSDGITFHNASNQFIDVEIEAQLHSAVITSLGYDLGYWCSAGHIGDFANAEPFAQLLLSGFQGISQLLVQDVCSGGSNTSTFTADLTLPTETHFDLNMVLTTAGEASPNFTGQSPQTDILHNEAAVTTNADATNTGLFFLRLLTPGSTYTSDSGTIYATGAVAGVPEPGSIALLTSGLIGIAALNRRWRRHRRCGSPAECV
jgi:hypothetical protein